MIHAYRHIIIYNGSNVFPDHNLFEILVEDENSTTVGAFLSSTISILFKEIFGRTYGGGSGPLKTEGIDIEKIPILKPSSVSSELKKKIHKKFFVLSNKALEEILVELGSHSPEDISLDKVKTERRELDQIIMGEILGLDEEEQLEVYRGVIDLVKSRITKAKSVDKTKKMNENIDIDSLKNTVVNHIKEKEEQK